MQTKEEFCTRSRYLYEIARYLGVSRYTLRRWLSLMEEEGQIKRGRHRYMFTPREVEVILDNMQ